MKRIRIDIRTENDAFGDTPEVEVVRILAQLGRNLFMVRKEQKLLDSNGNTVGKVIIT